MGIRSRRRTRTPATNPPAPPASRRRRLDSGHEGYVPVPHDLPRSPERRDWTALPHDVLWVILSLVPQADILRGAGLACASWRRLALDEPLLWRRIDLAADEEEDADPPAGWKEMACTAVRRSASRCESYRGHVNRGFLLFLARSAPSLRKLHVTSRFDMHCEKFMTVVAKELPLLEQVVVSHGLIHDTSLVPLVDHCPRLQLLDAGGCHSHRWCPTLRASLEGRLKDLRLPYLVVQRLGYRAAPRTGRLRGQPNPSRPVMII